MMAGSTRGPRTIVELRAELQACQDACRQAVADRDDARGRWATAEAESRAFRGQRIDAVDALRLLIVMAEAAMLTDPGYGDEVLIAHCREIVERYAPAAIGRGH